jgi:hypothetical protein
VFANSTDPVGSGLVESLARLGGNLTGFAGFEYGFDRAVLTAAPALHLLGRRIASATTNTPSQRYHPHGRTPRRGYYGVAGSGGFLPARVSASHCFQTGVL